MEGSHLYLRERHIISCLLLLALLVSQTEPLTQCKEFDNPYCQDMAFKVFRDCITCLYAKELRRDMYHFPTCIKTGVKFRGFSNPDRLCNQTIGVYKHVCCKKPKCDTIDNKIFSGRAKRGCVPATTRLTTTPVVIVRRLTPTTKQRPVPTQPPPTAPKTSQSTATKIRPPVPTQPAPAPPKILKSTNPSNTYDGDLIMHKPTKWPIMKCYGYSENGSIAIYHMCYGCVITTIYRHAEPPWLDCIRPLQTIYEPYSYFCNQYFMDNHILMYVRCCYSNLCNKSWYHVAARTSFLHPLGLYHATFFILLVTLIM